MVIMHVWFIGVREHYGEFAGKYMVRPLFLLLEFFCLVAILGKGSGVLYSGIYSLRGASLSLPTFATAQFKRFFDCGRAVRCIVPLGLGRFMHFVVLYGFQGADSDAEQLSLTEQLFDAALGELSVVARGQPCLLVGDFNVEPTKIPCLAKGISAGLWVDLEEAWALAAGLRPAVTCKRT